MRVDPVGYVGVGAHLLNNNIAPEYFGAIFFEWINEMIQTAISYRSFFIRINDGAILLFNTVALRLFSAVSPEIT